MEIAAHTTPSVRVGPASFPGEADGLRDFVDTAGVGLHCVAADGIVLWANAADYEPLGYRASEFIGQHISAFHADQTVLADILDRLGRGERLSNYRAQLLCKDGSHRTVLIHSSARFGPEGEFRYTRCLTVAVDARLDQLLLRDHVEREDGDLRERFLGIAAHDLRGPVSTMVMGAHLLASEELSQKCAAIVASMARASDRMGRLIRDLLDVARGRLGGGLPIARSLVDMGVVGARVIEELELGHPQRTITLQRAGGLLGNWDGDRLAQVFSNLIGNALSHGVGAVEVTLTGSISEVHLLVRNHGDPIPSEALGTLFEPFRRGSSSGEGLGLGLYIVSEVVRAHGATIQVTSHQDEGTTVAICWPRSAA